MKIDIVGDTVCAFVTASELARTGNAVVQHISREGAREAIEKGVIPYSEPGLQGQVDTQKQDGRLTFTSLEGDHRFSGVLFLAVQPDQVSEAQDIIERAIFETASPVIVIQSAFAVGTCEYLQEKLRVRHPDGAVVALPDVLQEGMALSSFRHPELILLGCDDASAEIVVRDILRPFNRRKDVIQLMSTREAEFSKLAISGMLATRLSFMNDMAALAEQLGVDIEKVRLGLAADPRIGESYLYPGCGFGGPGFSRDVMSLTDSLRGHHLKAELLERVLEINDRQKDVLFRKFWRYFSADIAGKKVAIWGVSFKPGTNRIQNAPSLAIITALLAHGVKVHVHDPMALPQLREWLGAAQQGVVFFHDPGEAVVGVDGLMLVTEWKEYWSPDWERLRSSMKTPLILDGRNIFDPDFVRAHGFEYQGVGRG